MDGRNCTFSAIEDRSQLTRFAFGDLAQLLKRRAAQLADCLADGLAGVVGFVAALFRSKPILEAKRVHVLDNDQYDAPERHSEVGAGR